MKLVAETGKLMLINLNRKVLTYQGQGSSHLCRSFARGRCLAVYSQVQSNPAAMHQWNEFNYDVTAHLGPDLNLFSNRLLKKQHTSRKYGIRKLSFISKIKKEK